MSDIKFDIYETPGEGDTPKYHVRITNRTTVTSKDLMHEAVRYTGVSRADWTGVVEELIDALAQKLSEGQRIHINGLGYFSLGIGSTEDLTPKAMTRRTVHVTDVHFRPEKNFLKALQSKAHFVRERYKRHTLALSPTEVNGLLTEYFKTHRSITCPQFQLLCGMTRSTAYRRLNELTQGAQPSLLREGSKNATAYVPEKGFYGRTLTEERW